MFRRSTSFITQKDAVLAALSVEIDVALDTTALEAQQAELQDELLMVSDLMISATTKTHMLLLTR